MLCIIIDILADNDYLPRAWLLVQLWVITTQVFLPSLFGFFLKCKKVLQWKWERRGKEGEGATVSILGWLAPQEGLNFMQYPIQGDHNNGEVLFGPTS